MDNPHGSGSGGEQSLWNGPSGDAWVEMRPVLDEMFAPFDDLIAQVLPADSGGRVLDVGCGTGGTTVALARRLGPQGRCLGVDVSAPMIAAARARAEREGARADFVRADAQDHPFEAGALDAIVSRFGVMFFGDAVRAFGNLRRAARDGGELRFVAWRGADENPFMTTAARAAAPLLPDFPAYRPGASGQFAFADHELMRSILLQSGWSGIDVQPIDVACGFAESELTRYFTRLGPLGAVLHEADASTRARVVEAVRPAFAPYVDGGRVRYTAACWLVGARAVPGPAS